MSHLSESEIQGLKNKAKNLRIDIIKMITKANSGHTGGSLSVIDLLTLLFFKEMKVNPAQPQDKERDRFVLSKGHAAQLCTLSWLIKDISRRKNCLI